MTPNTDPEREESQPTESVGFCGQYCRALRSSLTRRKGLSSDVEGLMKTNLKRCLGAADLMSYGLAAMLGGSIYVLTGAVMIKKTGPSVFVAYAVAGAVALLNSMVYSELACRIPKAGSSYTYAYILLGEPLAFMTGWSILLEYILSTSTVARGWSGMLNGMTENRISDWIIRHVGRLGNPGDILAEYPDLLGAALIFIMAGISCCGVRGGARVTGIFISFNVIVLITISIYMFIFAKTTNLNLPIPPTVTDTDPHSPNPNFIPFGMGGLIGGVAICFNAFIGFDAISTCAEEARNPNKDLPRANLMAVFTVTGITSMASLALALYYPWYMVNPETPFLNSLQDNLNGGSSTARAAMFYIVGCGCLIGLTSSLLSNLVAGPRISYAMSEDGLLPKFCSHVCMPFQTPAAATAFVAILTAILDLIFSIVSLADFLSLGTLISYSVASIGLLRIRYARTLEKEKSENELMNAADQMAEYSSTEPIMTAPYDPLSLCGKPGYLKVSWSKSMCPTCISIFNKGSPGSGVTVMVSIFISLNALLIIFLKLGAPEGLWPMWRVGSVTIILFFMCFLIFLMCSYVQYDIERKETFRLPLVPLFPCVTLSVNMFLISELSWITWVRFAIWLAIGLFIYLFYSVPNTAVRKFKEEESLKHNKESYEQLE